MKNKKNEVNKEVRNDIIKFFISLGMSYRRIGSIFSLSHTAIKDINKKYYKELMKERVCVLCESPKGLIDKEYVTICKSCAKNISNH